MSKITIPAGAIAAALAMGAAVSSATASPAAGAAPGIRATMPEVVTQVRTEPRRKNPKRVYRNGRNGAVRAHVARPGYVPRTGYVPRPGYVAPQPFFQDTVGTIVYDGYGYGYNRFTGQRYMTCMTDDGYGRVRPCDAGDGGRN